MMHAQSLPWHDPLSLAASVEERYWVLLLAGAGRPGSGRYSILAHGLRERLLPDRWESLEKSLSANHSTWEQAWFGYLGYGLKNQLEALPGDAPSFIDMPDACLLSFDNIYVFDHTQHSLCRYHRQAGTPPLAPSPLPKAAPPPVRLLSSNMRRDEYLRHVRDCITRIHAGELYQANITRKFYGEFADPPPPFALFCRLHEASPADYSAFLRLDDAYALSSSPELFLEIEADGTMRSRPIKGSAPRSSDAAQDSTNRTELMASSKNRAENLMIVDLVRNDLARACLPGTVQAPSLFEITSHRTIHHLSSLVTGRKQPDCSTLRAVMHCFPPGSMTGAPKVRAMQLCSEWEKQGRGIYSGAIGWFGGDGSAQLSVVIRTLLLRQHRFEFQAGGGIVADSTPESEWAEMLDKCMGIAAAIGLDRGRIEAL